MNAARQLPKHVQPETPTPSPANAALDSLFKRVRPLVGHLDVAAVVAEQRR